MKLKLRNVIQLAITLAVIIICLTYCMYINDLINIKILSIGDMNPYGGWSALKSAFIDISYRWRGISRSIALTIAIFVTSILMGRFFCGYICPIGTLQDFFRFIGKKLNVKEIHLRKSKYFNPEIIKYFLLIVILVLSILEMGKIVSGYSPWISYLNIFMGLNLVKATSIVFVIIFLSIFIRRVFCRCFCPLGSVQALLYAVGPLKIVRNVDCRDCSKCIKNCPVDIVNVEVNEKTENMKNVDYASMSPECINCLDCTNSDCIKENDGYKIRFAGKTIKSTSYILISLIMLFTIYIFLPIIPLNPKAKIAETIGTIKNGTYIGNSIGFGGEIEVEICVNNDRIYKIVVDKHNETSGYYEEVFKIISREIVEKQSINVDSVSGATVSSRGMINAVRDAVSKSIVENK